MQALVSEVVGFVAEVEVVADLRGGIVVVGFWVDGLRVMGWMDGDGWYRYGMSWSKL